MVKKCCVDGCKSNYESSKAKENSVLKAKNDQKNMSRKNIRVFSFPPSIEERRRWIKAIPYLTETKYDSYKTPPVVCTKHWPSDIPMVKSSSNGKEKPAVPPSIFLGVPEKDVPMPPTPSPHRVRQNDHHSKSDRGKKMK